MKKEIYGQLTAINGEPSLRSSILYILTIPIASIMQSLHSLHSGQRHFYIEPVRAINGQLTVINGEPVLTVNGISMDGNP